MALSFRFSLILKDHGNACNICLQCKTDLFSEVDLIASIFCKHILVPRQLSKTKAVAQFLGPYRTRPRDVVKWRYEGIAHIILHMSKYQEK